MESKTASRPRVLVVDDEPDITHIVKLALEKQGFIVHAFNEPERALEKFKPDFYNLALIDIRMPVLNGFELFTELRKIDPKLDVCFMTAYEQYDGYMISSLKDEGLLDCLIKKPTSVPNLIKLVMDRLSEKRDLN